MTKKNFIELAETIAAHNQNSTQPFTPEQLDVIASFCKRQNSAFMRDRWLGFIAGANGPSGGIKPEVWLVGGRRKFSSFDAACAYANEYHTRHNIVLSVEKR